MPDRFARLREIVETAQALPQEEREAYLLKAGGGDHELLADARELLTTDVEDSFLTPAPSLAPQPQLHPQEMRAAIAGYEIVRTIGQGGMGIVYEATQASPRRSVALKVLALVVVAGLFYLAMTIFGG